MNERELLEQAAKATGYGINFEEPVNGFYVNGYDENGDPGAWWNPLTDDGDALRLAVKLNIDIEQNPRGDGDVETLYLKPEEGFPNGRVYGWTEPYNNDPYAATRRAIVRAAAEIGKTIS